jgi:hypothetical protein
VPLAGMDETGENLKQNNQQKPAANALALL